MFDLLYVWDRKWERAYEVGWGGRWGETGKVEGGENDPNVVFEKKF